MFKVGDTITNTHRNDGIMCKVIALSDDKIFVEFMDIGFNGEIDIILIEDYTKVR